LAYREQETQQHWFEGAWCTIVKPTSKWEMSSAKAQFVGVSNILRRLQAIERKKGEKGELVHKNRGLSKAIGK
jgi:hypothetical protein